MACIKYLVEPVEYYDKFDQKPEIKIAKVKIGRVTNTINYIFDQIPEGYQITALKFINCGPDVEFEYGGIMNNILFGYSTCKDGVICEDGNVPTYFLNELYKNIAKGYKITVKVTTN
jgi:hypothetical protein